MVISNRYKFAVLLGNENLAGSPFFVEVVPGMAAAHACSVRGIGIQVCIAYNKRHIIVSVLHAGSQGR